MTDDPQAEELAALRRQVAALEEQLAAAEQSRATARAADLATQARIALDQLFVRDALALAPNWPPSPTHWPRTTTCVA